MSRIKIRSFGALGKYSGAEGYCPAAQDLRIDIIVCAMKKYSKKVYCEDAKLIFEWMMSNIPSGTWEEIVKLIKQYESGKRRIK